MNTKLLDSCVLALKNTGYNHVLIEEDTGRLVAYYSPPNELLALSQSEDVMSGRVSMDPNVMFRPLEFDLVIEDWTESTCRPWVVIQPNGRRSPGVIYQADGSGPLRSAPGGSGAAIKKIGFMALTLAIG